MTAMLSGVIVVAAFAGLAALGAFLVVALFRVSAYAPAGGHEADAASRPHGDFEAE